jgi:hypothetical protein
MPRKTAEAVSAAWYQAQQRYGSGARPKPPAWLGKGEAKTFKEIAASRAPDLFGPGNLELLSHYCFVHHQAMRLWALVDQAGADTPEGVALQKLVLQFVALAASLAGKLALLPRHQHGHRSGVLNERHNADSTLFGSVNEIPF